MPEAVSNDWFDAVFPTNIAWDIVTWCARVDADAREALAAALQQLPRRARFDDCSAELARHGRVGSAAQRKIFQRVRAELVERAQHLSNSREAA
jgi:hypothetical protein